MYRIISAAGFSLISKGREVSVAASSGSSLRCESILDRGRNSEYHEGRGENRGVVDSQDRLVIVHAGVKQGLDQREGKFGVLGTGDGILGLGSIRVP